ncbi:lipoprotein associated domain protein [Treponema socranskii subsp. socranskii VPI DR56BR1116 = ATCC 35536]|uniref:Lipoprotein associated domain protein n=1 Tax=Treponema socranskii subsp. socranskii VPI DR56BR1116 = ATCC 35536 TaxID=1125725 RepID=U1F995_TRESO|nr:lipoprotein 17-related variable surface protein [Treponema socranskii]ERF60622.1 lipoprotein associated domain protein [Treponema socranskii subsp. socranskii VPI DR56BR1116 = ATCC 35536]ERK00149.1 lipoprotein associated domain protein [Treponema socranskii subsp. socranskii VPI DR56BR1116 = ATCC 35536]
MKKTYMFILLPVLLFVLLTTGCRHASSSSDAENPGTNPAVPQNPYELTEADVLAAFGLQRGNITASAAAKKIANGMPAGSGITFTERNFVAYDDEAGTFTVKVKGTNEGKNFSQKISVAGFTHPLAGKTIQSLADCELNLDDAIEHNYSLTKYIAEVNKDPSGAKLVKKLSFLLSDFVTTIELGEHDTYTLAARAREAGTQVWVRPSVVFRKLAEGGTEEFVENTSLSFTRLTPQLKKNYFKARDVFQYILNKTADSAIKVDSTEFASSFYAAAKSTGQAPINLFTDTFKMKIQAYADLYRTQDTDEHIALDISYGAVQPKNGGIDADDYTGTVKINLCIATNQEIADQSGITAIKNIEKSGFAKIPEDAALAEKTHLFFNLIPKIPLTDELKTQWEQKTFSDYYLLRVDENGAAAVNNPFVATDIPFHLCVNSENINPSAHLGCAIFGASKTRNENIIFIENIQLKKETGSKIMEVQVKLKGSGAVLKVTADPGY